MTRSRSSMSGGDVPCQSKSRGSWMTDLPPADRARPRGSRRSRSPLMRNRYSSPGRARAISPDQTPVSLSAVRAPAVRSQSLKLPVTETVEACGAQTLNLVPRTRPSRSRWTTAPSWGRMSGAGGRAVGAGAATTGGRGAGAGCALARNAASRRSVASWGSSRVPSRKRTVTVSGAIRTSLTCAPAGTVTWPATRPS